MAQWSHYATPNEEFVEALKQAPPIALSLSKKNALPDDEQEILRRQKLTEEACRKAVEAAGPPKGLTTEDKRVPVFQPPGEIRIRVYTPDSQDATETFPVYVHIHGGGYSLGTVDTDEFYCRGMSAKHHVIIVSVDYRLAPQFPWPTGPEDSYEAVKWVVSNASNLRIDLKKGFIVGGISAGANFTSIITQRARSDPDLRGKITGQILQVPSTLIRSGAVPEKFKDNLLSFEQITNDPILSPENIRLFMNAYKPGDQSDPRVSPLLTDSFADLPPAYVQISGADPLRDEGLLYEQLMRENGVLTKLDVYPGVPHGFANYYPTLTISSKWYADVDVGIKWLLSLSKN